MDELVQIKKRNSLSAQQLDGDGSGEMESDQPNGISRRRFLKILGAASATTVATGCADSSKHKAYSSVRGEIDQVPGVAVWYRSTCQECTAGCGITVRTREGRVVKVEGNQDHPVNRGGLCALGQASVQALYDPDRVRQPLERVADDNGNYSFRPISWKTAISRVSAAVAAARGTGESSRAVGVLTGETSGSINQLIDAFCKETSGEHVVYDLLEAVTTAQASELVYGRYGVPHFKLEESDVVVNFGADFLETWVSPCEYARSWAKSRKKKLPTRYVHIEPRLSLTGANADQWLMPKPGTEPLVALGLLQLLLDFGKGQNLAENVLSEMKRLAQSVRLSEISQRSGISREKLLGVAEHLQKANASLVLAGGAAASSSQGLSLSVITSFLNLVLSNVGKTISIADMRKPQSSREKVLRLLSGLREGETKVLLVHGTNPAFSLPADYGFRYALNEARLKQQQTSEREFPILISFSSQLDETAELADLILPASHFLESWGDATPYEGVYSIVQPAMTPVFDTKSLGDIFLEISTKMGLEDVAGEATDFASYVRENWRGLHQTARVNADFDSWWREVVERGGFYRDSNESERVRVRVNPEAFNVQVAEPELSSRGAEDNGLMLYPYPSVKAFDGRSANRPWLQELPDPITQIVWDAWAEIHPTTAKKLGVEQGDLVTVTNYWGELNLPAFVSEYVHPGLVAVPMGQGHKAFGRFAKAASSVGNVFELLPKDGAAGDGIALLSTRVSVQRGRGKHPLVIMQGSDSQHNRHLAETKFIGNGPSADEHGEYQGGHHHHEYKQMYEQRKHPLYQWGMAIDLNSCTGCGACVVACYAENNIPVVGKEVCAQGREMSWLRIDRYFDHTPAHELSVSFQPMMCQHCNNAPCEPVCPVYATYHNPEGLNVMVYNRCVGTRYCSNNCSYKVRRFNWFEYEFPEPMNLQLNPDVTKRSAGVMEKCTFCVQRIRESQDHAKDQGRLVEDGDVQPACVQSCPTNALTFGNLKDDHSSVSHLSHDHRAYKVLDHHLNTQPAISYLKRVKYAE